MEKEKVVFFLDYANINKAAREKRYRLDYQDLLHYMGEGRFLLDAHCYVPINPRNEHRLDGVIEELWSSGYLVTTKMGTISGGTYTCNFDVEITRDVLQVVYQVKPDIIILATDNADFIPLILEVRKSGVRVETAAFEETVGADIMSKCSGFIDLAIYYKDYLAAQNIKLDESRSAQQYEKLIQLQNSEQEEENSTKQDQDLDQLLDDELSEEDLEDLVDQADDLKNMPQPDTTDELEL